MADDQHIGKLLPRRMRILYQILCASNLVGLVISESFVVSNMTYGKIQDSHRRPYWKSKMTVTWYFWEL